MLLEQIIPNQFISYLITFVVIVAVINSFDLIEGIDNLSSAVTVELLITMGICFYMANVHFFPMAFALIGSLVKRVHLSAADKNDVHYGSLILLLDSQQVVMLFTDIHCADIF